MTTKQFATIASAVEKSLNVKPGMYTISGSTVSVFAGASSVPAARYTITYNRSTKSYTFTQI